MEGATEQRVIPYLMEANGVTWERGREPVDIDPGGGIPKLLKPGVIEAEIRASGLEALGLVVDANGDARGRWTQIRARCLKQFTSLPKRIPKGGLQAVHPTGPRFGVWIMPDNRFSGMLEDLLVGLIPNEGQPLYEFAKTCVEDAAAKGAPFKGVHRTKAEIHTWLAWQDEPGKQLHQAVDHRVLQPQRPESQTFVHWFRRLFDL